MSKHKVTDKFKLVEKPLPPAFLEFINSSPWAKYQRELAEYNKAVETPVEVWRGR